MEDFRRESASGICHSDADQRRSKKQFYSHAGENGKQGFSLNQNKLELRDRTQLAVFYYKNLRNQS